MIVKFPFIKSIPSSLIIWSSVSTNPAAVESNVICPEPISSSNKNPKRASLSSASVPSNTSVLPKSSPITFEPASKLELSVPSKSKNWLPPSYISWYLSNLSLLPALKDATCLLNSKSKSSDTKKLSSSSWILSVNFEKSVPLSCKTNASNLSVPSNTKLSPTPNMNGMCAWVVKALVILA